MTDKTAIQTPATKINVCVAVQQLSSHPTAVHLSNNSTTTAAVNDPPAFQA